ncbi:MAG: DMT family transporter [Hyphomicrobiaceae bacterium]|nr:DMT family transporter [Hyphomicrobiaceae bacterium]
MPIVGIAFKILSISAFTVMITLIKLIGDTVPIGQIVFSRAFFAILPLLAMAVWSKDLMAMVRTQKLLSQFVRGMVGSGAMALWFLALARLPLPEATAIGYAAPFFTTVLAVLLLGETVRIYRWSAIAVGLLGVLVILSPRLGLGTMTADPAAQTGALFAIGSTFCMALAQVFVRVLTRTEKTITIVFYFSAVTSVLSLFTLPFGWVMPDAQTLAMLIGIGLVGGIGQLFLTQSYRHADVSVIAPFDYTSMIFAILVGWLLFAEIPTVPVLIGSAIVIAAGIFMIFRERRLGIERKAARQARTHH